jgi:hypothetical protein
MCFLTSFVLVREKRRTYAVINRSSMVNRGRCVYAFSYTPPSYDNELNKKKQRIESRKKLEPSCDVIDSV